MRARSIRRVTIAGVCIWATVAASCLRSPARDVRADDRNGDGLPDVWRTYDRAGNVVEQAIDSNFDGRSDVREYYVGGALVHRESDRNFDDRVDLVEDFDVTTHEHVRSVVDSDFDGTADLLVLFRGGQPVFSEWAAQARPSVPSRSGELAPLADPFMRDLAVRAMLIGTNAPEYMWTSVGLPVPPAMAEHERHSLGIVGRLGISRVRALAAGAPPPRGPPLA